MGLRKASRGSFIVMLAMSTAIATAPSSGPANQASSNPKRIRVDGQVEEVKLLFHPQPEYPPLAKAARIHGVVRFEAVIGTDGTVQSAKLVSGANPLLVNAALEAVKRWRYRPTLLNGDPVEVVTEISVNFTLGEGQQNGPQASAAPLLVGRPATVWVDNGNAFAVAVSAEGGRKLCDPAPHGDCKVEIGEAIHTVRAVDEAGKIVNEVQVTVMSGGKYVYNPGGQNCYYAKTQTYGTPFSTVPTPDEEQGFPEWLDVTRFDYVLEDFPKQVQGFVVGGATRTGLFHAPFERCQRLWIDNGNSFALTVEELKGRMLCRLPPGGHCRVAIKPGQHSFRAVDAAGNVVSQVEESTKAAGKYIYNPGRKSSYRLTSRTYSVAPGTFPGCASGSNENKGNPEWTDATEADYVFEPFPASVPASLFAGACATKKGLFRQ